MQIYIDGYKNLHDFKMEISDNKTNILFGMSGSGKSSVCDALRKLNLDFNKTIGSTSEPIIQVNGSDDLPSIQAFTKETIDELLLTEEANNIYDVIVDDSSAIRKAEKECRKRLNNLADAISNENDSFLMAKEIFTSLGSKLTKNKELSKTAKIVKLEKTITDSKDTRTLKEIKQMQPDKFSWVLQGRQYIEDNNCPYCEKQLSKTRLKKLDRLEAFKDSSYKPVMDVTAKYPDFCSGFDYTKSMITNLKRNVRAICVAYNNYMVIRDQVDNITNAKTAKLDQNVFCILRRRADTGAFASGHPAELTDICQSTDFFSIITV